METFRWIAVALSIILGLGVAQLLQSLVELFRARRRLSTDWIPLAWAACIFASQLQFWWALAELPSLVAHWSLGMFLTLVGLVTLLFLAAALVLPPRQTDGRVEMRDAFLRDGRWALVALSAYHVLALLTNWALWGVSPLSWQGLAVVLLAVLPLLAVGARTRRTQVVATLLYLAALTASVLELSPARYG